MYCRTGSLASYPTPSCLPSLLDSTFPPPLDLAFPASSLPSSQSSSCGGLGPDHHPDPVCALRNPLPPAPPPCPPSVKFMWEHREALGLTTTLSLEDLELHETAVLTIDAGEGAAGCSWGEGGTSEEEVVRQPMGGWGRGAVQEGCAHHCSRSVGRGLESGGSGQGRGGETEAGSVRRGAQCRHGERCSCRREQIDICSRRQEDLSPHPTRLCAQQRPRVLRCSFVAQETAAPPPLSPSHPHSQHNCMPPPFFRDARDCRL